MSLKNLSLGRLAVTAVLILQTVVSCVYIDEGLGSNFIPENRKYKIGTAAFPLTLDAVKVGLSDSLSGYSSSRITVGAIKHENEWETRSSAFTLVPVNTSIDFGKEGTLGNIRFHFTAVRDTLSVREENQLSIIQNIYVYELTEALDENYMYTSSVPKHTSGRDNVITKGIPTYSGGDSLSFDFSEEYAKKVIETIRNMSKEEYDDLEKFTSTEKLPGIYITSLAPGENKPELYGGRINMFEAPIQISDSYYVTGNYAELAFTADYGERTQVDTSFLFYFGPQKRSTSTTQYALNICSHSSDNPEDFPVVNGQRQTTRTLKEGEELIVQGGGGLKPVVSAASIKRLLLEEFGRKGIDPATVIVNKATVVFPIESDIVANYDKSYLIPQMLNPTSRITGMAKSEESGTETRYVTYAGLTDASIETENQGDVDRSLLRYAPDISHHVQEILALEENPDGEEEELKKFEDYDIWLLIMKDETVTQKNDNSYMSDYYQNLAYANYYNSMYDPYGYGGYYGGYGGYGYGSYGYGYNNYYSYMMMAQYANMGSSSTSTVTQLDKDRYYRCALRRPAAQGTESTDLQNTPHLKIIYSYINTKE